MYRDLMASLYTVFALFTAANDQMLLCKKKKDPQKSQTHVTMARLVSSGRDHQNKL